MASETIELRGHIIDSLILPKVLDRILTAGANFKIVDIKIGKNRVDQSFARIEVSAASKDVLSELLLRLVQHGAEIAERADVQLAPSPSDGVFPHDFYVTTNQQTFVRVRGQEIEVRPATMDSAIAVEGDVARAVKFFDVHKGDKIVVGRDGVRVVPVQRSTSHTDVFQFINASLGPEQNKSAVIRELASELKGTRGGKGRIALVAGPAVVRTGAGEHLQRLIHGHYIDRLFAGNAFAIYDVERALFGTAHGASPERALSAGGHENLVRATNVIRECGGITEAVKKKVLTRGLMYDCVRNNVDVVLVGSIRDEGPIPGVTTDVVEAQKIMRDKLADVTHVLLLGTVQHSMAVATLLAPTVKTVCVDIDPWAVERIIEHQPFQSIGLVTDVEPFLRELADAMISDKETAKKSPTR
jgi:lysine-ketoglutarate reductase/saccharopine dehydrogenase-like protein (TIGR00300 family)